MTVLPFLGFGCKPRYRSESRTSPIAGDMSESKETSQLPNHIKIPDLPRDLRSEVQREEIAFPRRTAGDGHVCIHSMDSRNEGQHSFWVSGQKYSAGGLTPPPEYRERASSPSEMTVDPYSARVSSMGHRNNPHYRSLDRRKEAPAYRDDHEDYYTSDDSGERDFEESKVLHYSIAYEKSSPSQKHQPSPFPLDRPGGPSKPLISYVRNDWRYKDPRRPRLPSPSPAEENICPEGWHEILCSNAFKRWMVLYLVLVAAAWIWWFNYYGPKYVEDSFLEDSLNARIKSHTGHFGMNRRVSFAGLTQLSYLDRSLVPGSEVAGAKKRRLVIVGDIHGCVDERK